MTPLPEDEVRDGLAKGPDAFRTISEVADELDVPQHVLRFWETRFPQIKPIKRGGGRRYYRPGDVELLRGVKQLLYGQGYTIRGVQRILREQGGRKLAHAAGAAEPMRREPGFAPESIAERADPGPEQWASGRRPVAQVEEPFEEEPEVRPSADAAQDDPEPRLVAVVERADAPGPVEGRLSAGQIGRLSAALDELVAVGRLLKGRF